MRPKTKPEVLTRTAQQEDPPASGQICFDAFSTINAAHGFPNDFPGPEATIGLLSMLFARPDFYCVVAEVDCRILGSNFLDERSAIRGAGPITIHPPAPNPRTVRQPMPALM